MSTDNKIKYGFVIGMLAGVGAGFGSFWLLYKAGRPVIIKTAGQKAHDDVERQITQVSAFGLEVFRQAGLDPTVLVQNAVKEGLEKGLP